MTDKRRVSRVPLVMEVTYESGDEFLSSFLSNISEGGIFIGTPNPLAPNTRFRLCFHVPGLSESFITTGTVVWARSLEKSDKPGMGVRFHEMNPDDRDRLDRYLTETVEG